MDARLLFVVLFGAGKFEDTFGDISDMFDPQLFSEQPIPPEVPVLKIVLGGPPTEE